MVEKMKNKTNNNEIYWNHNTAYHKWILKQVREKNKVLDVGCGDGLLVYRLAKVCNQVIGIDLHKPSIEKAKDRLINNQNVSIINTGFESFVEKPNSFDAIIFVASIHHMDLKFCIDKSIKLLKKNGKLIIVGLAYPDNIIDKIIEICRIIPSKIGSKLHNEKGDIGAPITDSKETLKDIREIIKQQLPNAKISQALYYRYLLSWIKP